MSSTTELLQLVQVTTAAHQKAQQSFQAVAQEEQRLRAELYRLDQLLLKSYQPNADVMNMRSIGADIVWQRSIGENKASLNLLLARVLAQKEPYLARVRLTFGRLQVARELQAQAVKARTKKHAQLDESRAISSAVHKF